MTIQEFQSKMNEWGLKKIPFLFFVDFEMEQPQIIRLTDIYPDKILYDCNGVANTPKIQNSKKVGIEKFPISFDDYLLKFDKVYRRLEYGDSYLLNLTFKTRVKLNSSLLDLFHASRAKYKLLVDKKFLVFSPEIFVQIRDNKIYSFPMKGTIDASIPDAEKKIMEDKKELAEHVTIVDLIRNDLSLVSENVTVARFRYIDHVTTSDKTLLQVSSEIRGDLGQNFCQRLGDILVALLPAGSVSGAPKPKTIDIIRQAEVEKRGYYTGVFGIFDGETLDSGVMIRFIECDGDHCYYRSGGGITTQSVAKSEYQEAIDKIYVPIN
jgi:para-aminobenzoate synthetase component I